MLDKLKNCKAPGLPELKQVELYSKWQKLVQEDYWESTCLKLKQEVLDRVENREV